MIIDDKVKEFIKDNIQDIEDSKWDEVYANSIKKLPLALIGDFTRIMLKADINPLDYLTYIPSAYLSHTDIEKFIIPNNINAIGSYSFSYCSLLKEISIPDSCESIYSHTFEGSGLVKAFLGSNIKRIGPGAFEACMHLHDIYFAGSSKQFSQIEKAPSWYRLVRDLTIHCLDEDIEI